MCHETSASDSEQARADSRLHKSLFHGWRDRDSAKIGTHSATKAIRSQHSPDNLSSPTRTGSVTQAAAAGAVERARALRRNATTSSRRLEQSVAGCQHDKTQECTTRCPNGALAHQQEGVSLAGMDSRAHVCRTSSCGQGEEATRDTAMGAHGHLRRRSSTTEAQGQAAADVAAAAAMAATPATQPSPASPAEDHANRQVVQASNRTSTGSTGCKVPFLGNTGLVGQSWLKEAAWQPPPLAVAASIAGSSSCNSSMRRQAYSSCLDSTTAHGPSRSSSALSPGVHIPDADFMVRPLPSPALPCPVGAVPRPQQTITTAISTATMSGSMPTLTVASAPATLAAPGTSSSQRTSPQPSVRLTLDAPQLPPTPDTVPLWSGQGASEERWRVQRAARGDGGERWWCGCSGLDQAQASSPRASDGHHARGVPESGSGQSGAPQGPGLRLAPGVMHEGAGLSAEHGRGEGASQDMMAGAQEVAQGSAEQAGEEEHDPWGLLDSVMWDLRWGLPSPDPYRSQSPFTCSSGFSSRSTSPCEGALRLSPMLLVPRLRSSAAQQLPVMERCSH